MSSSYRNNLNSPFTSQMTPNDFPANNPSDSVQIGFICVLLKIEQWLGAL